MFKRCFIVLKVLVELNDTSVLNHEKIITMYLISKRFAFSYFNEQDGRAELVHTSHPVKCDSVIGGLVSSLEQWLKPKSLR